MRYSTAAPRLALWKIGTAFGAVAAASLALAAGAGAQVFTAYANPTGAQLSLNTAISQANTAGGTNTVFLTPGRYVPTTGMTISGNLTLVGDHSQQNSSGGSNTAIDGSTQQAQTPAVDLFTIAAGANVIMHGFQIQQGGPSGLAAIRDNGTLTTYGMTLGAEHGIPVAVSAGANLNLNDSTIDGQVAVPGLQNNGGTMILRNSTLAEGSADGIDNNSGTFTLYNTLVAFQAGPECVGGTSQPGTTGNANNGSLDDDGTCNVQYSSDTSVDGTFSLGSNGGPNATDLLPTSSSVHLKGNPALCPVTDARFFINPGTGNSRQCDIGADTNGATQETAAQAPVCGTPTTFYPTGYPNLSASAYAANPATQTVPVTSNTSGFGPEAGSPLDIVNPGDAVGGVVNTTNTSPGGISNGSVALLSPFSSPQAGTLNVEATKATEGTSTKWSFTALDWAGLSTYCN